MPLLKRKPVLYHPLPSLASVLQPPGPAPVIANGSADPTSSSPVAQPPSSKAGKKGPAPATSTSDPADPAAPTISLPPDSTNDDVQLDKLLAVFRSELGTKRKDRQGRIKEHVRVATGAKVMEALAAVEDVTVTVDKKKVKGANGQAAEVTVPELVAGEEEWRIHDREVFYVEETGEIFTDYE